MALRKKTEVIDPISKAGQRRDAAVGWVYDAIHEINGSTDDLETIATGLEDAIANAQVKLDLTDEHIAKNKAAVAGLSALVPV